MIQKNYKITAMIQAIFASFLIALIILPIPLLLIANKRQKRKILKSLLLEFGTIGSANCLSFSSQEVLRNTVIGLDGIQRKLLVVERKTDDTYQSVIIDLNQLKSCLVNKQFRSVSRGDSVKPAKLLKSVSLVFNMPELIQRDVVFYNYIDDPVIVAPQLESKANHWQVMLTKLHTPQLKTADLKIADY